MKLKTFFIGLAVSFGIPWLLIVAYPFMMLKDKQAFEYEDKDGNAMLFAPRAENNSFGEIVYRSENCQSCHTQLVRNSLAGSDVFKDNWAGMKIYDDQGDEINDTRRESLAIDYKDQFASIGSSRMGPDLMNYGMRVKAKVANANKANQKKIEAGEISPFSVDELVYLHLYNPRKDRSTKLGEYDWSICPSMKHLFKSVNKAGQASVSALPVNTKQGRQIIPSARAKALKNYLLALDHDDIVPDELNRGPKNL